MAAMAARGREGGIYGRIWSRLTLHNMHPSHSWRGFCRNAWPSYMKKALAGRSMCCGYAGRQTSADASWEPPFVDVRCTICKGHYMHHMVIENMRFQRASLLDQDAPPVVRDASASHIQAMHDAVSRPIAALSAPRAQTIILMASSDACVKTAPMCTPFMASPSAP
jgi:hypothetical protein